MNWEEGTRVIGIRCASIQDKTGTVVKEMDDNECYGIQWDGSRYTDGDFHIEWSGDLQLITKLELALK